MHNYVLSWSTFTSGKHGAFRRRGLLFFKSMSHVSMVSGESTLTWDISVSDVTIICYEKWIKLAHVKK